MNDSTVRNKFIWLLFGMPLVIALGVCGCVILVSHFRLGADSPGIVALAKGSLSYWTPLLMLIFFVLPVIRRLFAVRKASMRGRAHGLSWYQYLDQLKREGRSLDEEQS